MVRLTTTECVSDPEVALMVTCETSGAGVPVLPGAVVFIPPQPARPPMVSAQASNNSAPLILVSRLRNPASPNNPSGSIPARSIPRSRSDAEYGLAGVGVAVAMATFTGVAAVPERFTLAGLKLQLAPVGNPAQERLTAPLKPFAPARLTCTLAVWPPLTLTFAVRAVIAKSPLPVAAAAVIAPKRPPFSLLIPAAK